VDAEGRVRYFLVMDSSLRRTLATEAQAIGVNISETFFSRLDTYTARFFTNRSARDILVIQGYLGQAGLRIARSEGRTTAEAEDAKAAIWLYHLPQHPDDPCAAAGTQALLEESRRARLSRGIITENLRRFLDQV
jgi:hypothetical protein